MNKSYFDRILVIIIAALTLCFLAACASDRPKPLTTGDITKDNAVQVCDILRGTKLSNVDTFEKWVLDQVSGNSVNDEETSGFSDANCRMTVMLLAGDLIKYDSLEESYTGDYLMFDLNAIESYEQYGILKDKERLFTTVFGEMPYSEDGFAGTLSERWKKHGIKFEDDRCSIISIIFKAYGKDEAFVGHTGILIDCRDAEDVGSDYVFVEKTAFTEPFRITLINDENELIDILSDRPEFTVEEDDPVPVVYKNGEMIGELKRQNKD